MMALAAPYAAIVMDMRTGETLYSKNANTRLHPASLTKMMTLYIAFQAIERGEISLDQKVTISSHAASQPPSRLGLKRGQKIAVRHLIRAAAIKSANDAAAALGDAISGDEARFAKRMNATARALGMKSTTFRNANGLTREGHLSTAYDMNIMGRHLFYDFPQYYNLFSRVTADAGVAKVYNTNRRFLSDYEGADGIKTGYTSAAGFNLTASARRGNKRVIATVFGGTSTAQRNAKMAELLDLGFARAPRSVREIKPQAPVYMAQAPQDAPKATARTAQVAALAPRRSLRPRSKPEIGADRSAILLALNAAHTPPETPALNAAAVTEIAPEPVSVAQAETALPAGAPGLATSPRPRAAPRGAPASVTLASVTLAAAGPAPEPERLAQADPDLQFVQSAEPQPETLALAQAYALDQIDELPPEGDTQPPGGFIQTTAPQPETLALAEAPATRKRPETVILAALSPPAPTRQAAPQVVTRVSSSGGRNWGVSLGLYGSHFAAERQLLTTALMESETLGDALRKVAKRKTGFEANFVGLTKDMAQLACARLDARAMDCRVIGP